MPSRVIVGGMLHCDITSVEQPPGNGNHLEEDVPMFDGAPEVACNGGFQEA